MIPYPNSNSIESTWRSELTFSGFLTSSAASSSAITSDSISSSPRFFDIFQPESRKARPIGTNITVERGVATPKNIIAPPTRKSTLGMENNCLTRISPRSASLLTFVTSTPVAKEIRREGI